MFDAKAFEYTAAMEPRRQQMNAVADFVNTKADEVFSNAQFADTASGQAGQSATEAAQSAAEASDSAQEAELDRIAVADMRDESVSLANSAASSATTAANKAGEAQAFRDQAAQISGLDQVEQAVDAALPTAPALIDGLRRSVEAASGGRMTVFYTSGGRPSYFVRQPAFLCEDIAPGGELGSGLHEAFKFGAETDPEIWVGAYPGVVMGGEAVSQPGLAPGYSINYDQARAACQAAGAGFDLMTIWDWAAVSLWCMARGFEPRGNTNHGRHHDNRWETAARQDGGIPGDTGGIGNILGGSGPAEWRHDGTMSGISDLVGNVWEWLSGMKMVDARVFLSPDNAIPSESGYSDTLFDLPSNRTWSTVDNTGADDALKRALIVPKGVDDPQGYLYTNLTGERLPFRGGARGSGAFAGLGALYLGLARTYSSNSFGFRPRFRNP
ncbi:hypothetical protein [Marinobacter shengliensis]|uniref:hypothetical protein n=1 Tax=Marinobacter shengliensis TaxID=1389223 RepID=UPI002573CD87|nr:hypothetical protein [Marinobacter shengliensis]